MWPSLPSFRPFGHQACPAGARCEVPHCLFLHKPKELQAFKSSQAIALASLDQGRETKRVKVNQDINESPALQATLGSSQAAINTVFVGSIAPRAVSPPAHKHTNISHIFSEKTQTPAKVSSVLPRSATRPISPPRKPTVPVNSVEPVEPVESVEPVEPVESVEPAEPVEPVKPVKPVRPIKPVRPVKPVKPAEVKATEVPEKVINLYPRKLPKDPAPFTRRLAFLKALHQYMTPLNAKMAESNDPDIQALTLSTNQLTLSVLDEEEKIALQNPAVYENVVKQRLAALKKMTTDDWIEVRKDALARARAEYAKAQAQKLLKPAPELVKTGLTAYEESAVLDRLITPHAGLGAHGYLFSIPADTEVQKARTALESACFWEKCDRCATRFQVFPDRREEDGALTTGGQCTYHWGKRVFPKKSKGVHPGPTRLSCCNEPVGSPGCSTHDTHVYKISDPKRLSVVMPFVETPENDQIEREAVVCFDCEMGYTTKGLELLRITALSWPTYKPLLDVLVRPLGQLLDVNTRFSGVTIDQYINAAAYDPKNPSTDIKDLRIVDSPYVARSLFLKLVKPETPVIGHALENDFNTIRLIHHSMVDTVVLYPHPNGLPIRNSLKTLARVHLGLDIQQGGAAGHDSFEDAMATGELARLKVAQEWKMLKDDGFTIRGRGIYPPVQPKKLPLTAPSAPSMLAPGANPMLKAKSAGKRKMDEDETDGNEGWSKRRKE